MKGYTKKVVIISGIGFIFLMLIILLSFCGGVSDAPDEEDEKSEETATAFALSIDGKSLDIDDYNDGYDKIECTRFTLTAKSDVYVQAIFFSITPPDVEGNVTVQCAGKTLATKLVTVEDTAVRITLDTAMKKGDSLKIELSTPMKVQSILMDFETEA